MGKCAGDEGAGGAREGDREPQPEAQARPSGGESDAGGIGNRAVPGPPQALRGPTSNRGGT